jgi:hypothetical protein
MGNHDPIRLQPFSLTEPGAAAVQPRRSLNANTPLFCRFRDLSLPNGINAAGDKQFFTECTDKFGIAAAFGLRTYPMLNVDTMQAKTHPLLSYSGKGNKHCGRISPAGNRRKDNRPRRAVF